MANDMINKHRRYSLVLEDKINDKEIVCPFPDMDDISFNDKHDLVSFDAFICYRARVEDSKELLRYIIELYQKEIYKLSYSTNQTKKVKKYLQILLQKSNEILSISDDFKFYGIYKSKGEYKKIDLVYPISDIMPTFIKMWYNSNIKNSYDGKIVRDEIIHQELLNQYCNHFISELRKDYKFRNFIMNNRYINKNVKDNIYNHLRTDNYQYEHQDNLEEHKNSKYRLLSDLTHYKTLRGIQKQVEYYNNKNNAKIMSDFEDEDLMRYITLNYNPNDGLYSIVNSDNYNDDYINNLDEIFSEYDLDDIVKINDREEYNISVDGARGRK